MKHQYNQICQNFDTKMKKRLVQRASGRGTGAGRGAGEAFSKKPITVCFPKPYIQGPGNDFYLGGAPANR